MLGPHEVLAETAGIIEGLSVDSTLASDHYTNYINVQGKLPGAKGKMLAQIETALKTPEEQFRPFFIGDQ